MQDVIKIERKKTVAIFKFYFFLISWKVTNKWTEIVIICILDTGIIHVNKRNGVVFYAGYLNNFFVTEKKKYIYYLFDLHRKTLKKYRRTYVYTVIYFSTLNL